MGASDTGTKQGDWSLKIVEGGKAQYIVDSKSFPMEQGSVWLCRGEGLLVRDHDHPLSAIHVRFRGSYAEHQSEELQRLWQGPVAQPACWNAIRHCLISAGPLWQQEPSDHMGPVECALATSLSMLEREARGPTGGRAGLDGTNLRAFLLAHRDQATDLDAFAAELGISRATLCRRARSELGDSLQRIHESMRLDEAAQLLRNDPRPIAAIAQACGYDDQRYFADRFRRRFNCSASTWRSMKEADLSGLAHEQEAQRRRGPQRNF